MLKRGIVFAMEAEEASTIVTDASVMDVTSDIVDDVEVPVSEVEELVESTDSAHDDIETLDKINDVMAESVESGEGLDPTAAQIAEIAVESIRARVGIFDDTKMPAMEAFGARGSRVAATKLAMESIGDSMTKVWNAIKAAFKKVWDMIKNLYKKFFDSGTKLKAAAESSLKRSQLLITSTAPSHKHSQLLITSTAPSHKHSQSTQDTAKNDTIKLPTVYAAFVEDGKVSGSNVVSILDNHIKITEAAKQIPSSIISTIDNIRKYTLENALESDIDNIVSFITDIMNRDNNGPNLASQSNYRDFFGLTIGGDDEFIFRSKRLAFNRAIYHVKKLASKNTYSATYTLAPYDINEDGDSQSESEISVLDRDNMKQISEKVKNLADTIIKFSAESKKIEGIDEQVDSILRKINKSNKPTVEDFNKKIAQAFRDVIKTSSSVLAELPRDNIRVSRVALDYVNASISEYENA